MEGVDKNLESYVLILYLFFNYIYITLHVTHVHGTCSETSIKKRQLDTYLKSLPIITSIGIF